MTGTLLGWRPKPLHTAGAAADETRMDTVELLVGDLDSQTAFYRDAIGLEVLNESGAHVTLGRAGVPIVTLTHAPDLPPFDHSGAGLYHTAIAFPDRVSLSAAVMKMAQHPSHLYQGATDHTFSNAFYFQDPEGNGIELYWDRPAEQWQNMPAGWMPRNTAIDPNAFLRTHFDRQAPHPRRSVLSCRRPLRRPSIPAPERGWSMSLRPRVRCRPPRWRHHHHRNTPTMPPPLRRWSPAVRRCPWRERPRATTGSSLS